MNRIKTKIIIVTDMLVPWSINIHVLSLPSLTDFFFFIEDAEKLGEIRTMITEFQVCPLYKLKFQWVFSLCIRMHLICSIIKQNKSNYFTCVLLATGY